MHEDKYNNVKKCSVFCKNENIRKKYFLRQMHFI